MVFVRQGRIFFVCNPPRSAAAAIRAAPLHSRRPRQRASAGEGGPHLVRSISAPSREATSCLPLSLSDMLGRLVGCSAMARAEERRFSDLAESDE